MNLYCEYMSTTTNDTETMTCEFCDRETHSDEGVYHSEEGVFTCDQCVYDQNAGALWYFRGVVAGGYTKDQVIALAKAHWA